MNLLKTAQFEAYLSSLTPAAARFLVREVELDRLKGGKAFAHDMVMEYARKAIFREGQSFDRVGSPLRIFCQPFEDLLVDNSTEAKQRGRISRSSLLPIWEWLGEEIAYGETEAFSARLRSAIIQRDSSKVAAATNEFHAIAVDAMNNEFNGLVKGDLSYKRLAARLGDKRVLEDAIDITRTLEQANRIMQMRKRLPKHIDSVGPTEEASLVKLHRDMAARAPEHAYIFMLCVSTRMRRRSDVLKVLTRLMGTQSDALIRRSNLAIVGECLLHDMEVAAHSALQAIASRAPIELVVRFLSHYFDIAEGFVGNIDVDMRGAWGRRIVAIRNALSSAIKSEIEATPQLAKEALYRRRSNSAGDQHMPIAWPDVNAVADARFTVQLMLAVRPYLSQIPINADYANIKSAVSEFVESIGEITIEDVRHSVGEESKSAEAYMKIISDFNEMIFGVEAAELLRRRSRAALHRDEPERKSA